MPDQDDTTPLSPNDTQSTESRMRRALGLQGSGSGRQAPPQQRADQARPRHRFVQDGGVPVVVLNSRGDTDPTAPLKARIAELEAAIEGERAHHAATKRAVQEGQATIQALQTRLAHTDLAHAEALAVERRARKEAEDSLHANLIEPPLQPKVAEPKMAEPKGIVRRAPRVPRAVAESEPQPVKWWLPDFRKAGK